MDRGGDRVPLAMPVLCDELLTGSDIIMLSTEDLGAYLLLVMTWWRWGGKPLDMSERQIARVTGFSHQKWRHVRKRLEPFFEITEAGWTPKPMKWMGAWRAKMSRVERVLPHDWREIRAAVFERDKYTCRYCREPGGVLECDHVIPVSRGGASDEANLVTACRSCNRRKSTSTPEEIGWSAS